MTWRRLLVILSRLPAESEYKTDLRDSIDLSQLPPPQPGVHGSWPQADMILAGIFDRLGDLVYAQGGYAKPPRPYPRPGVDLGSNVRPISPEALAYLEYKRIHQGEDPPDDWKPAMA